MAKNKKDPFWLGLAGTMIIITIYLLTEHARIAIALAGLIMFFLLLYFYSDKIFAENKKKKGGKYANTTRS
jgi:hypothetical protein